MDDSVTSWLDGIDPAFGHWLAGFTDGEGAFTICRVTTRGDRSRTWPNCRYQIALRADDAKTLQDTQRILGMGNLNHRRANTEHRPNENASVIYYITRINDCLRLVEFFTRFPLRAKKAVQFDIWADAVHEMAKGRDRSDEIMEQYRARLAELRKYVAPEDLARIYESNPEPIRHRVNYGDPPQCLCGCGGTTKIMSNGKGIVHPENPNYSSFKQGHYTRRILTRLDMQVI